MKTRIAFLTCFILFGFLKSEAQVTAANNTGNATNYVGSNNNFDVIFKRLAIEAGRIGTTRTSFGLNAGFSVSPTLANSNSTYVGVNAGKGNATVANNTGTNNSFFGFNSGVLTSSGSNNSFFGSNSGANLTTGSSNILIGQNSGAGLVSGSNNVFIGKVTSPSATTSNTIIIADGSGNQRLLIDSAGKFNFGTTSSFNKVNINTGLPNDSGLQLTNLTNTSTVSTANNGKVLAVDNLGKVILVNDATAAVTTGWDLAGNLGTSASTNFLGTTDDVDLVFKRNNVRSGVLSTTNTTFGVNSGVALTTSSPANTLIGANSGQAVSSGAGNVFIGIDAGKLETNSRVNVFIGASAGQRHTGGTGNTGDTDVSGQPISGNGNTFVGEDTGGTIGTDCTYLGIKSGYFANGSNNVYLGAYTGANIAGNANTFLGSNIAPSTTTLSNTVILADGEGNQRLIFDNTGAATITGLAGTNTGMVVTADDTGKLMMVASSGGSNIYSANGSLVGDRTVDLASHNLVFSNGSSTTNGKIYIGNQTPSMPTTTGNYKLYVEGGILTEKVRVALRNNPAYWADYVFSNDYKLMPLNEVEKYYVANKHLPNISSTQELINGGLDIADMQAKQMEKIEELTIYIVEQNKAIEALKAKVNALLDKK